MDICFWVRRCQTNEQGKAFVYCRITVNGVDCVPFSTRIQVVASKWDVRQKTTKDSFQDVVRQELADIEKKLRRIKLELEDNQEIVTAQMVKEAFLKLRKESIKPLKKTPPKKEPKLIELLRENLKIKAKLGAAEKTQENDLTRFNNIYSYLKKINQIEISCKKVDFEFVEGFSLWMRSEKNNSMTYTNRHITLISTVLDTAVGRKIIDSNPLLSLKLSFPEKYDPEGLTIQEIKMIEATKGISDYEQKAIDIFLFLCGTGIDHCDYMKLTNDNLREYKGKIILTYERQKTDKYTTFEVCKGNAIIKECALRIIEKYGCIEKLPKIKNSQNINRKIQDVGRRLGIKLHLSTKRGRKTFANISINNEEHSDEQTAYQLGHTTTKQLKHYRKYQDSIFDSIL